MNPNKKVTDPALLDQLEGRRVKDPNVLDQLNDENPTEDAGAYLDNLPKPEGFWSKLPRNILIGLTHAGRNLHNAPHDIVQQFEHATSFENPLDKILEEKYGIKQKPSKPLSEYLPNDTQDYSDVFGMNKDSKTLIDKLIQGGVEHAPEIIGAGGLMRGGFRRLIGTHNIERVRRAANNSGLHFGYTPETIQQSRRFLPPSIATDEMLEATEAGGFNAAFSTQSQIGHHQRTLARSPLAAEQRRAPMAGDLKKNMLGQLYNILEQGGLPNEAAMLQRGINSYSQYMQIRNAVVPVLKKSRNPSNNTCSIRLWLEKSKESIK